MRTTITIDDDVFESACAIVGDDNASNVVRVALEKMIKAEAALRLARLGGTAPDFMVADRNVRGNHGDQTTSLRVAESTPTYKTRKKTKTTSRSKKS